MAEKHQDTHKIGFKTVQIFKTQSLGQGSFGSVCKALCDDLLCAAKIIHPILVSDPNAHQQDERHRLPISRFMQECEFMSAIRHPNIVQYLGTHQDPQTRLPVLLMELMDDSLTHFLESSQDAVPYHVQVNFCHDITMAISYLHSNRIIHRDLSSNNVLLRGNVQAKVTDFGMAKLSDINPQATPTMCPGTEAYMPPETVKSENPVYTAKIDCFAIGVLIIQILTRCFPKPGDRHKTVQTIDPRFQKLEARVPEIERRQNHISEVDPKHPLLPIALDCLKESDIDRPSAQELCRRLAHFKETPQFTESAKKTPQDKPPAENEETQKLQQQIKDRDDIIQLKNDFIQQKDDIIEQRNDIIREKIQEIDEKEEQINTHTQQLESCQRTIAQLRTHIGELENDLQKLSSVRANGEEKIRELQQQIHDKEEEILKMTQECNVQIKEFAQIIESQLERLEKKDNIIREKENFFLASQQKLRRSIRENQLFERPGFESSDSVTVTRKFSAGFTLEWAVAKKAPCKMYRGPNAVVDDGKVYIRVVGSQRLYAYNSTDDTWEKLPQCLTRLCSLAVVDNILTTIGGRASDGNVTNQLLSLTRKEGVRIWEKVFQSMPTKRSASIVVCTGQALIVAGGWDQDRTVLTTVEVMEITSQVWSSAADLPIPLENASATICQDHVYLIGGFNANKEPIDSVYTCSLTNLFLSCLTTLGGQQSPPVQSQLSLTKKPTVWDKIADLPVVRSTCVTLHGQLLAIGGNDLNDVSTSNVYLYHPTSNTWEVISRMECARYCCFAAVLPNSKILVAGSNISILKASDSVEIATMV